ncbi:MAG: hypothetical protein J2P49_02420 [Methylocapsa sp.]|nr:hypothetical protein [Methylocapsa sp.]
MFLGAELFSPESENIDQKDQETARSDCQKCGPNFGGYGLLRPNRLDEILRIFKQAVYIYNLVHASMGFLVVVRKAVPLPLGCQLERFRLARTGDNAKSIS